VSGIHHSPFTILLRRFRYLGYHVESKRHGAERRADSPKPPEPMQFANEPPVKGDAHADAFAEGVDNITVLTTETFRCDRAHSALVLRCCYYLCMCDRQCGV
jgi:hypothetical protein